MKNRERLRNMALFDLLCMIHYKTGDDCVLELVGVDHNDLPCLATDHAVDCKTCLNNWLNKEEEHDKNT